MTEAPVPAWALERGRAIRAPVSFNASSAALLIIDMQNYFLDEFHSLAVAGIPDLLCNIDRVAGAMRLAGCPVIWVQHSFAGAVAPADGDCDIRRSLQEHLVPGNSAFELDARLTVHESDLRTVKTTASVFHPRSGSNLLETLQARGVETLVISGIVTNGCCETTARDASQHGFQILFASDATGAVTAEEHNAALLNLALWFAEVLKTDDLLALFARPDVVAGLPS